MRIITASMLFLLCSCFMSKCSTDGTLRKDSFSEKKMSIYIRVESLDIPETATDEDLKKIIVDKGLVRYKTLMSALGTETEKNDYIESVLNKEPDYKIIFIHEYDYYTESMMEFTIPPEVYSIYRDKYPLPKKKNSDDE